MTTANALLGTTTQNRYGRPPWPQVMSG